jgi:hypothetical protein
MVTDVGMEKLLRYEGLMAEGGVGSAVLVQRLAGDEGADRTVPARCLSQDHRAAGRSRMRPPHVNARP